MIRRHAHTFLIDASQNAATRATGPSLKDAKRWHYMQMLFIILLAAQILPWSSWCSPQQHPSKVYAQGFVISSLRATVSAALFTTAFGKLNTNLEGSICCPGGLRDRLILCVSHWDTMFTPESIMWWKREERTPRLCFSLLMCFWAAFIQ